MPVTGYTAEQLGSMFQSPASWFKEKARLGEIPYVKIGGKYRFTDQHIAEIIALFEQRPTAALNERSPGRPRRLKRTDPVPTDAGLTARAPRRRSA